MKLIVVKIKLITLIVLACLLFYNCASKKEKISLIAKTIDIDYSNECDTTSLIYTTLKFDTTFFKYYKEAESKFKKNEFPSNNPYITWIDNKQKWILSDEDINFMLKNKSKLVFIKKNEIKSNKIIVLTDFPVFKNSVEKNNDFTKQIINCNYLVQFSLPIFNKENSKAVLMCKSIYSGYYTYFIFVKEKKEWIFVGNSNNYTM
jgi:hypothetical protein